MAENPQPHASSTQTTSDHATENIPVSNLQDWNTGRYEQMAEIGVGAYGVVYKAKDMQSNEGVVAMKCLRVENTEQGMPLSMVREIALLRQLEQKEHPNVVKLLDICLGRKTTHETQLMLVFEHIDQDLDMYLSALSPAGLEGDEIKNIMVQMLRGIDFLHSMRVIHRDLKPQNILITHSGKIKIADFGLARIFSVDMALTAVVVTLWYRAPEVLLQDSYASPVDLWSVGCIFAELFNRRPLFRGSGDVNQLRKIFDLLGRPLAADWPADVAIPITSFPVQSAKPVGQFVPRMDEHAADLLLVPCVHLPLFNTMHLSGEFARVSFLRTKQRDAQYGHQTGACNLLVDYYANAQTDCALAPKLLSFDPGSRPNPVSALQHKFLETHSSSEIDSVLTRVEKKPATSNPTSSSSRTHRRLPYTQNMGAHNLPNDENAPIPPALTHSCWHETESHTSNKKSIPQKHSAASSSGLSQTKGEKADTSRPAPSVRERAFGNPLPLNVTDGASGSLLPIDPYQESAFLTPPSDLASTSSDTESSSSRTSSSPERPPHSVESFLKQQSTGLVLETSVERPESATLSHDSDSILRRSRAESEGQSRMSWTCDPLDVGEIFSPPSFPTPACAPEEGLSSPKQLKAKQSTTSAPNPPPLSQNNEK